MWQMSQCEQLTVVGNLLPAKHRVLQILCCGTRTEETAFQGKHRGSERRKAVLLMRTWACATPGQCQPAYSES